MSGILASLKPRVPPKRWLVFLVIATALALFAGSVTQYRHHHHHGRIAFPDQRSGQFAAQVQVKEFVKPDNVTIVALVFFGRRSRVEMLRCYLQRNLVDNGGWLDEVHWILNTAKEDDLKYLDEVLQDSPRYKKVDLNEDGKGVGFVGYGLAWNHLDRGKLYVKIDDDVVWFADDSIPRIVTTKIEHPEYLVVSANMINSPLMGWIHYHMGAMHPYLPEFGVWEPPNPGLFDFSLSNRKSWHYTDYPYWQGPDDWFFEDDQDPPYPGHRWLRLEHDKDIHRTPIVGIEYKSWGKGLMSWAIAAQEHYSFLENLQNDRLDLYKFGKPWTTDFKRLSINFMTLWADDVLDNLPMDTVDEEWLTVVLPQKLGRSIAVDSDALAVHFTFGTQGGVTKTDLLARYHDYAIENACPRKV